MTRSISKKFLFGQKTKGEKGEKNMFQKRRWAVLAISILMAFSFLIVLGGCGGGGGKDDVQSVGGGTTTQAPNESGVRKDIEEYINSAYPDSAKKRAALMSYARALQTAYSTVTNETEAMNMEPKIMNSMACAIIVGGEKGEKDSPSRIVENKTTNTPERLADELKYEAFLDGKVFEVPSPNSAPETVCDFDPNVLPN
jgi:hypothetical protein